VTKVIVKKGLYASPENVAVVPYIEHHLVKHCQEQGMVEEGVAYVK
jgi:hypothetical protein